MANTKDNLVSSVSHCSTLRTNAPLFSQVVDGEVSSSRVRVTLESLCNSRMNCYVIVGLMSKSKMVTKAAARGLIELTFVGALNPSPNNPTTHFLSFEWHKHDCKTS